VTAAGEPLANEELCLIDHPFANPLLHFKKYVIQKISHFSKNRGSFS
jgi:hypothetical protein